MSVSDNVVRLFGFTSTDAGYSQGSAGAIKGTRSGAANTLVAETNLIENLNGDPALFPIHDLNDSRLVLRQYTYSTSILEPNRILAAQGDWSIPIASETWNAVANLHGVATDNNKWLFATGYDLAKIAVVDMRDSYKQKLSYDFPASFPTFQNPYTNAVFHGEALQVVNSDLYALFYINNGTGYSNYYDSIIAKFNITSNGNLIYRGYVTAGKNSFTLDLYENKLYVCSLGGMQNAGSYNADSNLCIIDIENFDQEHVVTVAPPSPQPGDYRDISIVDANNVYIFLGYYGSGFGGFTGKVYHTTLANINNPALWTLVVDITGGMGFLWGIHADGYRLWLIKGTPIAVYDGTPTTLMSAPSRTFTIEEMSSYSGGNLNSACFIAPDLPSTTTMGTRGAVVAKSMTSQIRLAQEARMLAAKLKEEEK